MKKFIFLVLLFLITCVAFTQEVISTAGATKSNSGYELSWTVGEPVINMSSSGNTILTQGFHQSKLIITAIDEKTELNNLVNVFPNPAKQFAIVKFNKFPKENSYKLFDLSGRILESKIIGSTETHIDLTRLTSGTYLLKIIQENDQPLQTFKIIKQ